MIEEMISCIAGIDYNELRDLERHGVKTFELVCTDNVRTAQNLKKGDKIFIVNLSKQDIKRGVEGVIGKVMNVKVDYWRTVPREFDEKELLATRIQLSYVDEGRVIKSQDLGAGNGMKVSFERHVLLG